MSSKVKELAKLLKVSETQAKKLIDDGDYLVLTDSEATEKTKEYIREMLWAFKSDFIMEYLNSDVELSDKQYNDTQKAIEEMQKSLCENANEIIYSLISNNYDDFVETAIETDGRGHFLAGYDGDELETENYFVYRNN